MRARVSRVRIYTNFGFLPSGKIRTLSGRYEKIADKIKKKCAWRRLT